VLVRATPCLALAACLGLACDGGSHAASKPADAGRTLVAWLECEECGNGELDAVVALGADAVPLLAATLEGGLSPATRGKLEAQLGAYYDEARARGRLGDWSREEYVTHHLDAREAGYRSRAAQALGRIGGERALSALRAALAKPQRPSVEQSLREALGEPRVP
jgi:HEAT repeat protein